MIHTLVITPLETIRAQWGIVKREFVRLRETVARIDPDDARLDDLLDPLIGTPAQGPATPANPGILDGEITSLADFITGTANATHLPPSEKILLTISRIQVSKALLAWQVPNNTTLLDEAQVTTAGPGGALELGTLMINAGLAQVATLQADVEGFFHEIGDPLGFDLISDDSIRFLLNEDAPDGFGSSSEPPETAFVRDLCNERMDDLSRFIDRQIESLFELSTDIGRNANILGIREGVEDLGSYPVLTSDLGPLGYGKSGGGSAAAPTTARAGSSFQGLIDSAFNQVLGRIPRTKDQRSFLVALNQSFDVQDVAGHTVITWQARSYAGQSDLGGGVTGAQASLYARALDGLEDSLKLLDGLEALRPEVDLQDAEAIRAIMRTSLTEVVSEMKTEGGPRIARVDGLFQLMLGSTTPDAFVGDSELVGGQLAEMRKEFGFEDFRINTLDEESMVSNFLALKDYIVSILVSWVNFKSQWFGRDLGTRLVLLSRALSVVAESVGEVEAAMDSVFVGAAERQVASFVYRRSPTAKAEDVLVDELLSWIRTFTMEEAPVLVHEGGRRGVGAMQPTLITLEDMTRELLEQIPSSPTIPNGMRHSRVRRAVDELRGYLDQAQILAEEARKVVRS